MVSQVLISALESTEADANLADAAVAIYAISDSRFFLGLVALVNSLRLQGHGQPIYVLDCGLADYQREMLSGEATLITAPAGTAPHLLKYLVPLQHPADIMILIDADIIVTRSLEPLIEAADEGKIVAFTDKLHDRFDPRWSRPTWAWAASPSAVRQQWFPRCAEVPWPRSPYGASSGTGERRLAERDSLGWYSRLPVLLS